ncbi:YqeB family protein [Shouchella clausii]|uniref:50S ribosomal protein L29 n=1 Tax=Shouchella clausii TaxID=79880 RepID=A0A268P0F4_SHOCL|nr:hypothetical protein [Shouchella clausii]MCM3314943.1 hypothetical protein [Psychrobacillus sp. MER TA 17]KKI86199.1 hypothetical protein WZ76_12535 [Shouchella clausii]MDO7284312.1 hypothetical protein [Shouchella clausii]MDO7304407.1 hypothetical protein [Shouchella clausii]PAE89178.1 hypothetical protein CHH72_09130 [Shouchella clausii]
MQNVTKLGPNRFEQGLVWIIPALVGGAIGWFLPAIIDFLLSIPFLSSQGVLLLIDSFSALFVSIAGVVVGVLLGLILSGAAFHESLVVDVSDSNVTVMKKNKQKQFLKTDISAVFVEHKSLVILGANGKELYRETIDVKQDKVEQAFWHHRYPWVKSDPFANAYRLWTLSDEACGEAANKVLYSRRMALREGESEQAERLREDLRELGIAVKDKGEEQYIRCMQTNNSH